MDNDISSVMCMCGGFCVVVVVVDIILLYDVVLYMKIVCSILNI